MRRQPRSANTGRFVKRKSASTKKKRGRSSGKKSRRRRGTIARILGL